MKEPKLIATLVQSREAYNKLLPYLNYEEISPISVHIIRQIEEYYNKDTASTSVDVDLLKQILASTDAKKEKIFCEYLDSLPEPVSLPNLVEFYASIKKEHLSHLIIQALSIKDEQKASTLMEEFLSFQLEEIKEEVFNGTPIGDLSRHFEEGNLIPIYPSALNTMLKGGVPRQSQVCLFARPDVGKTTAAINMAVSIAEHGFKVIYLGNEDAPSKMMYRILTRFTRTSQEEIQKDPEKYFKIAVDNGYKNLYFIPAHPGTLIEIRKWVEKIRPDVVVVDQIRNLNVKKDSMTINLEQAAIGLRNLAKEFDYVSIVVTQAGDSASKKLYLDMEDVDSSKTGLAGQMDLMIGIGQNEELKSMNKIVMTFPKNKFTEPLKPITCDIEYAINRIRA